MELRPVVDVSPGPAARPTLAGRMTPPLRRPRPIGRRRARIRRCARRGRGRSHGSPTSAGVAQWRTSSSVPSAARTRSVVDDIAAILAARTATLRAVSAWTEVGDRVYVRRYAFYDQNIGVVLGDEAALVVDTRISHRQAAEVQADLRELTRSPSASSSTPTATATTASATTRSARPRSGATSDA